MTRTFKIRPAPMIKKSPTLGVGEIDLKQLRTEIDVGLDYFWSRRRNLHRQISGGELHFKK